MATKKIEPEPARKPDVNPPRGSGNTVTPVPMGKEALAREQEKGQENLKAAGTQGAGTRTTL